MSTDTALSVIQGWSALLDQLFSGEIENLLIHEDDPKYCDHPLTRLVQENLWPLFTKVDIIGVGSRLRLDYPWLLDFEGNNSDFAAAFSKLKEDPNGMANVLLAYCSLIECESIKRSLVPTLRLVVKRRSHGFSHWIPQNQLELDQLANEADDRNFLESIVRYDFLTLYEACYNSLRGYRKIASIHSAYKDSIHSEPQDRRRIQKQVLQFTNILPPLEDTADSEDLRECILRLRAKAHSLYSGSQMAEIEQLKRENEKYKNQVQEYERTVSDVSFRHLLEMLPIAAHAATGGKLNPKPLSGPEWKTFWSKAWTQAANKKDSPLHNVYNTSKQVTRKQIEDEGSRLFGTLSANIHNFGREYNPEKHQRGFVEGCILSALKPENFTTDGDVDWDKEQKRFIL